MLYQYDYLNQFIEPDFANGLLYWKQRPVEMFFDIAAWKRFQYRLGIPIGSANSSGYNHFHMPNGKAYYNHIVLWVLNSKQDRDTNDAFNVDHKNGNKTDNRIDNLRLITPLMNNKNVLTTNPLRNISWRKREKKWYVRVVNDAGKRVSVGYFNDIDDAIAARNECERKWGYTQRGLDESVLIK